MEGEGGAMIATQAIPFEKAWPACDLVLGWLTECEGRELYAAALQTPDDGQIVEVGSFMGRSTSLLAHSGRSVLAVDPLEIGVSIAKTKISQVNVDALNRVCRSFTNVRWSRTRSTDTPLPERIDLLYIDGRHKYPSPLEDYRHFWPALRHGALVAFHDYGREFGVTKSVDELIHEGVIEFQSKGGTMIVCRYL
jgi:predicted O-methyltransferase YrrM